jgi:hypothetical protein
LGYPNPVHLKIGRDFEFSHFSRFLVDMDEMKVGPVFFCQIDGMGKGGPGVFGKVGAKKNISIIYHYPLLSGIREFPPQRAYCGRAATKRD